MKEKTIEVETSAEYLQSGVSVDINPPFRGVKFIANKKLDDADTEKLEKTIPQQERLQFVIVGDLSIKNHYDRLLQTGAKINNHTEFAALVWLFSLCLFTFQIPLLL